MQRYSRFTNLWWIILFRISDTEKAVPLAIALDIKAFVYSYIMSLLTAPVTIQDREEEVDTCIC